VIEWLSEVGYVLVGAVAIWLVVRVTAILALAGATVADAMHHRRHRHEVGTNPDVLGR
jgi:hypothetical protein